MSHLVSFWSIPPIQDAINVHLTRNDIRRCILVSKAWAKSFSPFLWRTISLYCQDHYNTLTTCPGLSTHHLYTHTLRVHNSLYSLTNISTPHLQEPIPLLFPNLVTLTIPRADRSELQTHNVLTLLESRLLIRSFAVYGSPTTPDYVQHLCSVIDHHLTLQELVLSFHGSVSYDSLRSLLHVSGRLRRIYIMVQSFSTGTGIRTPGASSPIIPHSSHRHDIFPKDTELRNLTLISFTNWRADFVFEYLAGCPQLRRLSIHGWHLEQESANALTRTLSHHCPHFVALKFLSQEPSPHVETVIGGVLGLKFIRWVINVDHTSNQLADRLLLHADTLEHLDLSDGKSLALDDFWSIVSSCSKLRILEAGVRMKESDVAHALYWYKDRPWASSQLQTLQLQFERIPFSQEPLMDLVFKQVGSKQELKSLQLNTLLDDPVFVRVFKKSVLGLIRLQKLEEFTSTGWGTEDLGKDLIDGMVRMWPVVERIVLSDIPKCTTLESAFGLELSQRRPLLEFQSQRW